MRNIMLMASLVITIIQGLFGIAPSTAEAAQQETCIQSMLKHVGNTIVNVSTDPSCVLEVIKATYHMPKERGTPGWIEAQTLSSEASYPLAAGATYNIPSPGPCSQEDHLRYGPAKQPPTYGGSDQLISARIGKWKPSCGPQTATPTEVIIPPPTTVVTKTATPTEVIIPPPTTVVTKTATPTETASQPTATARPTGPKPIPVQFEVAAQPICVNNVPTVRAMISVLVGEVSTIFVQYNDDNTPPELIFDQPMSPDEIRQPVPNPLEVTAPVGARVRFKIVVVGATGGIAKDKWSNWATTYQCTTTTDSSATATTTATTTDNSSPTTTATTTDNSSPTTTATTTDNSSPTTTVTTTDNSSPTATPKPKLPSTAGTADGTNNELFGIGIVLMFICGLYIAIRRR